MRRYKDVLAGKLRGGRFMRGVVVLAGGTALGQLISVAASPLITRLYSPDDFGVLSIYLSFLSILGVLGVLRYEKAIPLADDDQTASEIVAAASVVLAAVLAGCSVGLWLFGDSLVEWANVPELRPYLWLVPVGLLGFSIQQVLLYWALRKRAYCHVARTNLTRNAFSVAVQAGTGIIGIGPLGLLVGSLIGQVGGSLTLARVAFSEKYGRIRQVKVDGVMSSARQFARFPLISSWSGLLNAAGIHSPPILLASGFGVHVAGAFALAQRVIEAPLRLVGTSVADVYFAEAARLVRVNPREFVRMYFKIAMRLAIIGVPPILVCGSFSPWAFGVVFGEEWRVAGEYVRVLAPYFAVRFVVYPLSQTLNILQRQDLQLYWDAGRLMIVIAALSITAPMGLSAKGAILSFGAGMSLCYVALFLLTAREVVRVGRRAQAEHDATTTQVTV